MDNDEMLRVLEESKKLPMDMLQLAEIVKMLSQRVDALEHRLEAAGVAAQRAKDELVTVLRHVEHAGGVPVGIKAKDLAPTVEQLAIAIVMAGKP